MTAPARVLVIDIGKTNLKAALVDTATLAEIDIVSRASPVLPGPPYAHLDVDGIWRFILDAARTLQTRHGVDAIVVTTHAATAALVDADGALVLPVLDYEDRGPEAAPYDAVRPAFAETGAPRLPAGLNLGAQLFWQLRDWPDATARATDLLLWPQYWAFRLSGIRASEVTSLGAHTDLWAPGAGFSSLVIGQGWGRLMPPLRDAAAILGPLLPELAATTGIAPATPVLCGIHDSNASLLPHLLGRPAPFAVVSTGTWVIAMAIGGRPVALDPSRDTLVNVDARGAPVPSARFMGGREFARITEGQPTATEADLAAVLARGVMLLPAVEPGSGPFQGRAATWTEPPADAGERAAAASLYLGLMTGICLDAIGADGPVVLEGPLAANTTFTRMLAAHGFDVEAADDGATGTSAGAALLVAPAAPPPAHRPVPPPADPRWRAYAERWRAAVGEPPARQPTRSKEQS